MSVQSRLDQALRAANIGWQPYGGHGVSFGRPDDKTTWIVQPANMQAAAQPVIDAFSLTEPTPRPVPTPGTYLGVFDADPVSLLDGDLWIVREAAPKQRRVLKVRDGDVTRALVTLVI